jgi:hypothetical protein
MQTTSQTFTVHADADYGFIVADASVGAKSFAMVPAGFDWSFDSKAEAKAQAIALSGKAIPTRMIETPDRFEAVADTLYGPAWE